MDIVANILVSPPQLRQTSKELIERARRLAALLADVESRIDKLDSRRFEGTQAEAVRNRFNSMRERIRAFPPLITSFASDLEEIAEVFEKEDLRLKGQGGMILGINTITSLSSGADRFQYAQDLIIRRREIIAQLDALEAKLGGSMSPEEIHAAIYKLQAERRELEQQLHTWQAQYLPDLNLEGGESFWDKDGKVPWRVIGDDLEDKIAEIDQRIETLQTNLELRAQLTALDANLVDVIDGNHFAPGTGSTSAQLPSSPPLTGSDDMRDPQVYDAVINQFGVESNPRYAPRGGNTYCNIFTWDVTRAMGAEIPHWVDSNGNPAVPGQAGAHELNANATHDWLRNEGQEHGWRAVSAEEAQQAANNGQPSVAAWRNPNPSNPGHIAVVRPGEYSSTSGPAIAQAGGVNTNDAHAADTFGGGYENDQVVYYVHD